MCAQCHVTSLASNHLDKRLRSLFSLSQFSCFQLASAMVGRVGGFSTFRHILFRIPVAVKANETSRGNRLLFLSALSRMEN